MESYTLEEGINGWATGRDEYVRMMDEYDALVWEQIGCISGGECIVLYGEERDLPPIDVGSFYCPEICITNALISQTHYFVINTRARD